MAKEWHSICPTCKLLTEAQKERDFERIRKSQLYHRVRWGFRELLRVLTICFV